MNIENCKKIVWGAGVAAACAFGSVGVAMAAPTFTVNPTVIGNNFLEGLGLGAAPFQSTFINGESSSLVTLLDGTNQTGTGWINFTGFGGNNATSSGLGVTYSLWAEYQYTASLTSGTFGSPGSVSDITSLTFTLWASTNTNGGAATTTFTNATTAAAPSVVRGAFAQQVGFGSLISGAGGAVVNGQGGTGFNSVTSYSNTAFGNTFFTAPNPFYNILFNEFNNTAQGVAIGTNGLGQQVIAVNQASGGVDFNIGRVPEPATLLLLGAGLIGLGVVTRRSKV